MPPYDPQPYRKVAMGEKLPQSTCYVIGQRGKYVVLDRDGDRLVLRALGYPDAPKFEIDICHTAAREIIPYVQGGN